MNKQYSLAHLGPTVTHQIKKALTVYTISA